MRKKVDRRATLNKTGDRCAYCGRPLRGTLFEVDHIEPLSRGGEDDESNMVAACRRCNRWKGSYTVDEFRLEIEAQRSRLKRHAPYVLALDFGVVTEVNTHTGVVFWFERITGPKE